MPPFSMRGEFSRQNGPSSDCDVSVLPLIAVVEQAHQRGDAERAGHQHEFVVRVGGELAHLVQDGGGLAEFGLGQAHVAHEAVQVGDERAHDLAQARIARSLHHFEHGWGHVFLALDQHVFPPE